MSGRARAVARTVLRNAQRAYLDPRGWWVTSALLLLAAAIRLPNLGWPHAFSFDETYYAKDAFSLLRYGYERAFVGPANDLLLAGNSAVFRDTPEFVVHPPLGKWAIAAGIAIFGMEPLGWRIVMAILGIAAVALVHRVTLRLTGSVHVAAFAGLFMAIDGIAITLSRTALLDQTLMFFVLVTFWALLRDRDAYRHTLTLQEYLDRAPRWRGLRPWRLVAIVAITCAFSTKWSALWFALAFAWLALWWDARARHELGVSHSPWLAELGWLATASIMGVGGYLLSWIGWFRSSDAWGRAWTNGVESMLPQPISAFINYHRQALHFHVTLTSDHPYEASPFWWLLQVRPTSFFYEDYEPYQGPCGLSEVRCASEVLALGNVIVWWTASLAIVVLLANLLGRLLRLRLFVARWQFDGREPGRVHWDAVIGPLAGVAAGWLPWLYFHERTTFTFYTVVFTPFICMLAAQGLALFATRPTHTYLPLGEPGGDAMRALAEAAPYGESVEPMHGDFHTEAGTDLTDPLFTTYVELHRQRFLIAALLVALAVLTAVFLMPVWTGALLPYDGWRMRMLFGSWI